jgi:5-methylcytosine-specific restriction endonuclease McrA
VGYDPELARRLQAERKHDGHNRRFYKSAQWRVLRARVLAEFHGECQDCLAKSPSRYTPATCVHHEAHVDTHPGWALSETYVGRDGKQRRNLVPLCHSCHDARHGRDPGSFIAKSKPLTEERW